MLIRYCPRSKFDISDMSLGNDNIAWCNTFRYLGVTFIAGRKCCVNTDLIKQHFFVAVCNSILGHSYNLDKLIRLKPLESYCLPIIQY